MSSVGGGVSRSTIACEAWASPTASDLAAGRLVALLPGWLGEAAPLHWMAVGRHRLTPALRRLAAHLRDRCVGLAAPEAALAPAPSQEAG